MALKERVDRLEAALTRLARAQAETQKSLRSLAQAWEELARAQARAEERLSRLEDAVGRLTEAQARAEERLSRLEDAVGRLTEAQARAEERLSRLEEAVGRLAEAQARAEERLSRLEEAQVRMEEAVRTLAQQVSRLGETIGFTLEDLAREVTPAYLAQHYGIHVPSLDRRFFMVDGQEVEVDLYGEGTRDGEAISVVGEVRSRIYSRDVEAAVRRAGQLSAQLVGTPVVVVFGFVIHPSAREAAARLGAIVISSSGR